MNILCVMSMGLRWCRKFYPTMTDPRQWSMSQFTTSSPESSYGGKIPIEIPGSCRHLHYPLVTQAATPQLQFPFQLFSEKKTVDDVTFHANDQI